MISRNSVVYEWSQELLLLIPLTSTLPWFLSETAHECLNWQNRQKKTSRVFLTLSKSLHYLLLLLFVCHTVLKPEILLSRSLSKPFRARAVSGCLSIQVQAQQVPVLVIACKCYYRIPGNNGKKGWSHPELLSHLLTSHGSFCISISESAADLLGPSGPKFGKLFHYSPTFVAFDKTGSCQIRQRNISLLCSARAQEAGHDIQSQGAEHSLA